MAKQGAFTTVAEIAKGKVDSLRDLLWGIGNEVNRSACPIAFGQLKTVHFMRWLILEEGKDAAGRTYPAYLVLATNYDEPLVPHLDELVRVAGPVFEEIYSHCKGYVPNQGVRFLKDHSVGYEAFYVGTQGRSVAQIRAEAALRDDIQTYLDDNAADLPADLPNTKRDEFCAQMREHFTTGKYQWVKEPADAPPVAVPKSLIIGVGVALLLAAWAVSVIVLDWPCWLIPAVLAGLAVLFLIALRVYEKIEPRPAVPLTGAEVEELTSREDQVIQNQLTHFVAVKPYIFRRLTMRVVLRVINLLGRLTYVRGELGGIPSLKGVSIDSDGVAPIE